MINESVRQSSIHLNKKLPPGPGRLQDVDPSGPPAMLEVQTQEVPSGNFNKLCLKQLSKQLLAQNPSESLSYWTILQRTVYIQCQSRKWVELPAESRTVTSWRSMDVWHVWLLDSYGCSWWSWSSCGLPSLSRWTGSDVLLWSVRPAEQHR